MTSEMPPWDDVDMLPPTDLAPVHDEMQLEPNGGTQVEPAGAELEPRDDLPTPTLQNIVATCSLGMALDLKTIALTARNAEYNPRRFAAVIMRIREPKTTALIFASGKIVVTGSKTEEQSRTAAKEHAVLLAAVEVHSVRWLQ